MNVPWNAAMGDRNLRIFLKYDGMRESNVYTVIVIDRGLPTEQFRQDTDNLYGAYMEALKTLRIPPEDNDLFYLAFLRLESSAKEKYGSQVALNLGMDTDSGEMQYHLNIATTIKVAELSQLIDRL